MSPSDWECSDCGVRVRFELGVRRNQSALVAAQSQPDNWVVDELGWHCLRCQREAVLRQPTIEGAGSQAQQRRRALVRFELLREPAATNAEIARRVRCRTAQVAPIRRDLVQNGDVSREDGEP